MSNNRNANLISQLNNYIEKRHLGKEYYSRLNCFAVLFSFSKTEKIIAATALKQYLEGYIDEVHVTPHLEALNQGNLKKIWLLFKNQNPLKWAAIMATAQREEALNARLRNEFDPFL